MYRRLLLSPVSLGGCRKLYMSKTITKAADTNNTTIGNPVETLKANELDTAKELGERTHDYIDITNTQRIILGVGSSLAALINPRRFV